MGRQNQRRPTAVRHHPGTRLAAAADEARATQMTLADRNHTIPATCVDP